MIQRSKNRYPGMILGALSLMLAVLSVPGTAHAEGYSCTVSIPVETEVTGENAPDEEFVILLEADGENVPMPEQTQITIKGAGQGQFGPVTYTAPGDYQYRVYQKAGTTQNYTYDDAAYTVTVRVTNDGNGGLTAQIWAIEDGQQNKTDRISFSNQWQSPPAAGTGTGGGNAARTGDTSNAAVPTVAALAAAVMIAVIWKTKRKGNKADAAEQ